MRSGGEPSAPDKEVRRGGRTTLLAARIAGHCGRWIGLRQLRLEGATCEEFRREVVRRIGTLFGELLVGVGQLGAHTGQSDSSHGSEIPLENRPHEDREKL
jgi:hypothetical protein